PKDGQLKISQSRSGEGVELVSLDSYLDRKQARGVKLYASDPLAEARDLLQDRAQGKQQGKGDQEHTQGKQHEKGEREHKPVRPQAPAEHSGVLRQQDLGDLNTDLQKLQQTLQKLGYKDAQGQALKTDGSFDDGTGEAVKAFQRAHGLQANGIVGRDTLSALKQAEKSPLLSEKTNPDHPLYSQAVSKLEQLGPQAFANRRQLENTAGSLAFEAKVSGMQHIDVVIQSKDGSGLFAVEGNPNDPAQKRIYTDKSAAAENSLAQSSNALRQDVQVQDHQEQKRAQAR
ncbi:MAG TPA: peptidoglycan-binding domain-containing protein, partial [Pseudoxanthomonas sp.]|nr:peptidoglycan-binding domain-containing protein [Pseudoxanthomonas sp.]